MRILARNMRNVISYVMKLSTQNSRTFVSWPTHMWNKAACRWILWMNIIIARRNILQSICISTMIMTETVSYTHLMITLKEIAKECNVSATTVSNILNGKPKVSEETRKRVLDVIQKSGDVYKRQAVMDSSKRGKCSKKKVLEPEQVDVLLMDGGVSQEIREKYGRKGIRIE